jgi:hypothetical protein
VEKEKEEKTPRGGGGGGEDDDGAILLARMNTHQIAAFDLSIDGDLSQAYRSRNVMMFNARKLSYAMYIFN